MGEVVPRKCGNQFRGEKGSKIEIETTIGSIELLIDPRQQLSGVD